MIEPFVQQAPAKVNLALHVVGRRADGYHELDSLMVFADIGDELTAVPALADRLAITGPFGRSLGGDNNLVSRAVAAFRARWPGHVPFGLDMTLAKNLPVAAGLGGGSADAAAAIRLMAGLGEGDIPAADLVALAAGLGADVPACLVSVPLVARGIGEIMRPLKAFPACHVVLVNPLVPVVTAEVFRRLESRENPPMPAIAEPMTRPAQLGIWLTETRNDLEPAATVLVPQIGDLIDRLGQASGCMLARMSGSGATVFGLFGSSAQAHQAAHELREAFPDHWVAAAPLISP
ncbi:4-(cytidine 5'-diphospho)-2-C-methyl-D-erythritol kinase [Devosia nitrariae]|uniref:4-diphosphocytidyl-2-C-methyl-D-erythritol kinase n=1 Tax=Devosia nitrariae TaxID=2071872 RepID=A0ABQ5W499_9HYPH|nr:4-(cytidine 5'-diphospho)-2-C-methyl-D-erythritol kinase [Devosia nitrariae]GLQ54894.1 4-diphosphocytidyl-2-C-methyl-D-erythritol kinase [Devosia nitrariae]